MSGQPKVLIVDDINANRELLSALMSDSFDVLEARNAAECFDHIEYSRPDLVLLDVLMPQIDGDDVCYNLKKNPETKDIPVVFISSLSQEEYEDRYGNMSAEGYITKPVDVATLNSIVNALIPNIL